MSDVIEVFRDGAHVGQFTRSSVGLISFTYDEAAPDTPISLSLPRDGSATRHAAQRWLDNLLPDNPRVRGRWARSLGVPDEAFDLVRILGEDVAGALVLLPEGEAPDPATRPAVEATLDDLAERVAAIINDPDAWVAPDQLRRVRMSLNGSQGKFTAARIGRRWFWPSAALPSTHILKPAIARLEEVPAIEAGTLALARRLGVPAPDARVERFYSQETYVVARFDRDASGGTPRRVHTEDLAQAAGEPAARKYAMTARQALALLGEWAGPEAQYAFVRELAFNTAIGNADAHSKNYSLILDDGVRLAPLYDSLPTTVWPQVSDDRLAMPIAGASRAQGVQVGNWAKLARTAGLDEDRVVAIARETARGVRDLAHDTYTGAGVSAPMVARLDRLLDATTAKLAAPAFPDMSDAQAQRIRRVQRSAGAPATTPKLSGSRAPVNRPSQHSESDKHVPGRGM